MRILVFALASGLATLAGATPHAAKTITGDALGDWMRPLLSADAASQSHITPRYLEKKRLVIPSPALLIAFSESGCVLAAKPVDSWTGWPTACLAGTTPMPSASDFMRLTGVASPDKPQRVLALVSPLYDAERLKVMFPGKALGIDGDLSRLNQIAEKLESDHGDAYIVQVPVAL